MDQPDQPPRLSAALAGLHRDGGFILGVVAKRTYIVDRRGCHVAPEQTPLVEEPVYSEDQGILDHDADVVLQRERADIIVQGHAYAPGLDRFDVRITVGELTRDIAVFGDRRLERHRGQLTFTPAEPLEKIALSWQRAYGGVDHVARQEIGDPVAEALASAGQPHDPRFGLYAYPRNPMGTGYLLEPTPSAIAACRLPNFEEPRELLTPTSIVRGDFMLWPRGPRVAATGWQCHNYFPRVVQFGVPPAPYNDAEVEPRQFWEVDEGHVHADTVVHATHMVDRVDPRAAQQSAMGMRADRIPPGASIELRHLHPKLGAWSFALPAESPTLAYGLPDRRAEPLRAEIRTLLLEPDLDRVTIVWVGETRVSFPVTPRQLAALQHGVVWP